MSITTALPVPAPRAAAEVGLQEVYRLSVEQYHRMIAAGILTADDRVELLEGLLVRKMTKNPPHTLCTQLLRDALPRLLPAGWFVNDQEPVAIEMSEPEPDVAVVRGDRRQYAGRRPGPQDVVLVIEVADTSLGRDRGPKKRDYARAGIPVYWIVNLVAGRVEVYTAPSGPAEQPDYGRQQEFSPGEAVPVVLDGREVGRLAVADVLP